MLPMLPMLPAHLILIPLQAVVQPVVDAWINIDKSVPGWLKFLILAHAVNTWPTPHNKYGQWALGLAKFTVGQRLSAVNTINGLQSEVTPVTTEQKQALKNGSKMEVIKPTAVVHVTPVETIIVPAASVIPDQKER